MDLLRKMTTVKVDTLLDRLEDPEVMLPQLLREFEEKVTVTVNAEAKALSAVRAAQRRVDESRGKIQRLTQGAELALSRGDEALAREALTAQVSEEQVLAGHQRGLDLAEKAHLEAREVRAGLMSKMQELRDRKAELQIRAQSLGIEKGVNRLDLATRSVEAKISALEGKAIEAETAMELNRELTPDDGSKTARKLADLEKNAAIEERLRRMRKSEG